MDAAGRCALAVDRLRNKVIREVPNPNAFTTLPAIKDIIKVTIQ